MSSSTIANDNVSTKQVLVSTSLSPCNNVLIVTMNRPRARNAISSEMFRQISAALHSASANPSIRAVVLTGTGTTFSAGADIKELGKMTPEIATQVDFLADWNRVVSTFHKPLLAAVNGLAFGGGFELALMCDIVHCAKSATFALPEITLGTIPGAGGTQRLISLVGKSRAFEMIMTGDKMSAEEALQRGVVSKIHTDEDVLAETVAFAERIAEFSPTATNLAKQALKAAESSIAQGIEVEKRLYHLSFGTGGFREGVNAFLEKRDPKF